MPLPSFRRLALFRAARDHARAALLVLAGTSVLALALRERTPVGTPATAASAPTMAEAPTVRSAVRVYPRDEAELAIVQRLALDQWSEHVLVDGDTALELDVVVDADGRAGLDAAGVTWETVVDDIDALAAAERARLDAPQAQRPTDWYAEYHDFTGIQAHLEQLARERPEQLALSVIGGSAEGRPLLALRIGGTREDAMPMLINGAQHAREWIAAVVPICIADRLTRADADAQLDARLRSFVETTELWVVPVVNPDGYQYSWSSDRFWRKNRREGHGVDLNRNFSVAFGGEGSSSERRSQIYRGPYAFSEPETAALRDLVRRESIAVHVDFHSYGQLLLHPWTYTAAPAPARDRYAAIGDKLASAIHASHGQRYEIRAGAQLYPAAGTMTDWMYGEAGALSFTIELRPRGGSGFVLPPSQIRPTCDEALAAVLELRAAASPR